MGFHQPSGKIYAVLLLAPLARETGLVLPVAFALSCLLQKKFRAAVLGTAMVIPWLGWMLFVQLKLWVDATPWLRQSLTGGAIICRAFGPLNSF
jgi:hypothetical protein